MFGCEIWTLTLREERKLRLFVYMVLRRIFVPRRDEVRREWRRLHNEELNDLNSSPKILRVIKLKRMRWAGHVGRMGDLRGLYRIFSGETAGGGEEDNWGILGVNGCIILGWISGR